MNKEHKYLDVKGFDSINDVLDHFERNNINLKHASDRKKIMILEFEIGKPNIFEQIMLAEKEEDNKKRSSIYCELQKKISPERGSKEVFSILTELFGFCEETKNIKNEEMFFLKASKAFYKFLIQVGYKYECFIKKELRSIALKIHTMRKNTFIMC